MGLGSFPLLEFFQGHIIYAFPVDKQRDWLDFLKHFAIRPNKSSRVFVTLKKTALSQIQKKLILPNIFLQTIIHANSYLK